MGFFGGDKLIIGYDLGREHAQISFAASQDGTVETLSQVAGEEKFSIPTALCKRYGANQWLYGRRPSGWPGKIRACWWKICWSWRWTGNRS